MSSNECLLSPQRRGNSEGQQSVSFGGYDVQFTDKVSSDIEAQCPICLLVMRDPHLPVTCKCGTHFCKTCIEPVFKKRLPCPICKEHFKDIAANVLMKRTIENKKVYCTYKKEGCYWEGELRLLDFHLKNALAGVESCMYHPELCKLCKKEFPQGWILDHQKSECFLRPYQCKFCNYTSTYTDVTQSHKEKCDYILVYCTNNGCMAPSMPRKDLKHHLSQCPETVIDCEFKSIGCRFSGPRRDLNRHRQDQAHMSFHMSLLAKHDRLERQALKTKMESELRAFKDEMKKEVAGINQTNVELRQENARYKEAVKSLKMGIEVLKGELLTPKEGSLNEQVKRQVSFQVSNVKKELIQRNAEKEGVLQEAFARVYKDMKDLKSEVDKMRVTKANESSCTQIKERIEEVEDLTFITLSSQLGRHPVKIHFREFERWKKSKIEWTSPSFYLEGYKFCLMALLNPDLKQSAGGYFSLYSHLMRGENDNKLLFPFKRTLVIELVHKFDETNNKKQYLTYTSSMQRQYNGRVMAPDDRAKKHGLENFITCVELNSFLHGQPEYLIIIVSIN